MDSIGNYTVENELSRSAHVSIYSAKNRDKPSGHPVCLPASFLKALTTLNADEGAATLIQTSNCPVLRVDVNDSGVMFDIDTPEQAQ